MRPPKIRIPQHPPAADIRRMALVAREDARFDARSGVGQAEITLYDQIGHPGVTAADFRATLDAISAPTILLRLNSPGGNVFDAIAMYNDLIAHAATVTVDVTGVAASGASLVAMAGDTIRIARNAMMMVHRARGLVIGDRADMREMAAVLEKIDAAMAETYAARTGHARAEMAALMDTETWMGADDAVARGFADETYSGEDDGAVAAVAVASAVPNLAAMEIDMENVIEGPGVDPVLAQKAVQDFKNKPEIAAEFRDVARYYHFLRAKNMGLVKIRGDKTVGRGDGPDAA